MQTSGVKINLKETDKLFIECSKEIEKVLQFAVREAIIQHKRNGNSIAVWKDGKAVLIDPKEIELEEK